jgi:hypothetical protein
MKNDIHIGSIVFVATAYSHPDPAVTEQRKKTVSDVCSDLVNKGIHAVSPVIYGLALYESGKFKDTTWNTWSDFCTALLLKCDAVYVIKGDGWDKSLGVAGEILVARTKNVPVFFIDPLTLEIESHGI